MFSAKEALRRTLELRLRKEKSMQHVLGKCFRHVQKSANNEATACLYEVPEFIIGLPVYDLNECIQYVHQRLLDQGFQVGYLFPRILLITWHDEKSEKKIMAAAKQKAQPCSALTTTPMKLKDISPRSTPVKPSADVDITKSLFVRSIKDLKPSGRLVLDLT